MMLLAGLLLGVGALGVAGRGRKVSVKLDRELPYELDGGARPATTKLRVRIAPSAVTVRVPRRGGQP
jgi:diacylglycerol kinase family enzyme